MTYSLAAKLKKQTAGGFAAPAPLPKIKPETPTCSDFLAAVLPDQGHYCLFLLPAARHLWAGSVDGLASLVEEHKDLQGVYFATASFKDRTGRTQANALALKAFRLDLDAGEHKHGKDPAGTYATQGDARQDLRRFTAESGLSPSYVISSGEGLHVYYVLDESCPPSEWQMVAEAFKRVCAENGLRADPSVTADSARVLRPVGALHKNGKRVEVLEATGKVYTLAEFAGIVQADEVDGVEGFDVVRTSYDLSINADVLQQYDNTPADSELIRAGCAALAEVAEKQGDVPEPLWRAMLGVVKFTVEGDELAHEWSMGYDGYDERETNKKLAGWTTGPTTCAEFSKHTKACTGCKHKGAIKSPIVLGMVNNEKPKIDPGVAAINSAIASGALRTVVDQDGVLNYVETFEKDGRVCRNVYPSGSQEANDLIMGTVAGSNGKPPSQQAIAATEARLRNEARRQGTVTQVHIRVAQEGETRYHDLGPGRIARISAEGWAVTDESDDVPLFRRGGWGGGSAKPNAFSRKRQSSLGLPCEALR